MPRVYHLLPHGRPMRALRVLTRIGRPITEGEVFVEAGESRSETWHIPLNKLVHHGFAVRSGGAGAYMWEVTEAGRLELAAADGTLVESLL